MNTFVMHVYTLSLFLSLSFFLSFFSYQKIYKIEIEELTQGSTITINETFPVTRFSNLDGKLVK